MNIVYAIKIFVAFMVVLGAMRVVLGRAFRDVLDEPDLRRGWIGIVGTLAAACFSVVAGFYFVSFALWAILFSRMLGKNGDGRLPAYALLVCITPQITMELKNIGPINDLIRMTAFRVLALVLLVPEALRLVSRRHAPRPPSWLVAADAAVYLYFAGWMFHAYSGFPLSSVARGVVGDGLDTVLPYYVMSRGCVDHVQRRRMFGMFLLGATYQAVVGMCETAIGKYLYTQLQWLYGITWAQSATLMRGSFLRATAASPGPVVMGVLMMFAVGLWFATRPEGGSRRYRLVLLALLGGLFATISRGSWLATAMLLGSVWLLRRLSPRQYVILFAAAVVALAVAWKFGFDDLVVQAMQITPGNDERAEFNVRYRQELLNASLALLKQSPWIGVRNYLQYLQDFRQGEGIIDIVNTYLVVLLNVGLVGLVVFLAPYGVAMWRAGEAAARCESASQRWELAVSVALNAALLAVIFTVSPVSTVRLVMTWTVAICLAQAMAAQPTQRRPVGAASPLGVAPRLDDVRA